MKARAHVSWVGLVTLAVAGCGLLLGEDPTKGDRVTPSSVLGGDGAANDPTTADGGRAQPCTTPAECPAPSTPCVERACTGDGRCAEIAKATADPLPGPIQTASFCFLQYCEDGKVATRDAPSCGDGGICKAGACSVPASCNGAPGAGNDCGSQLDNCCASITVPGGTYKRRFDGVTFNNGGFPANVSPFRLDKYEVTVGRFRAFAQAGFGTKPKPPAPGQGAHPKIPGSGWLPSWNAELADKTADLLSALQYENSPVTAPWYLAFAFCIFDGGRLPTEAEWGFAASGGSEQRVYPWSTPPSSTSITPAQAFYDRGKVDVGISTGTGKWGHFDLAGNVAEWVLDRGSDLSTLLTCSDCAFLKEGEDYAVAKGTTPGLSDERTPASVRIADDPWARRSWSETGFRCARDL